MQTLVHSPWTWVVALSATLGLGAGTAHADQPLAGKWKVTVLSGANELPVWLLQIDEKDGKFTGKVLSAGLKNFDKVKFDKVVVMDNVIHADVILHGFILHLSAYAPKDTKEPKLLLGSLLVPGGGEPIRMERTDLTKLDPEKAEKKGPGADELAQLMKTELLKDRIGILKAIVKKFPDDPVALQSTMTLLDYIAADAKLEELKERSEVALKFAKKFGPELEASVLRDLAPIMLKSEKGKDMAVGFAQKAKELLPANVPASDREITLKVLRGMLKEAGKDAEAKKVQQELVLLGPLLDAEFKKTAIPFDFEPFKGRKKDSKRVAVVELFTGAQCPPCVAADAAFDALLKTFNPNEVILLQYHLHIPGPDPMVSPDSEKRGEDYYGVSSTPTLLINGKKGPSVGGAKPQAKDRYEDIREELERILEEPATAEVALTAKRMDNIVQLTAKVGKLPKDGKKLKLRFVVVEENVAYPGFNKQRFHHNVVRGFAGGVDGVALKEGTDTYEQTLDLKKLKLDLIDYLAAAHKKDPFPDDARPLDLQHLKVVALIQSDETKEVLNAAQVTVPQK